MSIRQRSVAGLKWQGIEVLSKQCIALVVFSILSRILDAEEFGLFGLVSLILLSANLITSQGLDSSILQRPVLTPEHLDTAFWTRMGFAAAVALSTVVFAEAIAGLFSEPRLVPFIRASAIVLLVDAAASIHNVLFSRNLDFRTPAIRLLVANSIGGVVGVTLALQHFGTWALVGQQLATSAAGAVFIWVASSYRPAFRFSRRCLADLSRVSSSVFLSAILWFLISQLDRFTIGKYLGPASLGIYMIALKLPDTARIFSTQPVSRVLLPILSRLQGDHERLRNAIYKGMDFNAMMSFAIFSGMAAVVPHLIPLAFGPNWDEAILPSQLLAMLGLSYNLQVFVHPALLASGGVGRYVYVNLAQFAGVLVACYVGTQLGTAALIVGLIINANLILGLALLHLKFQFGLSPWQYLKPCVVPAAVGSVMFVALVFVGGLLPVSHFVCLAIKVPLGAVIFIGFTLAFNRNSVTNLFYFLDASEYLPAFLRRAQ